MIGVIAAHPDDEVLGCGATIAVSSAESHVLILGEGATSRHQHRDAAPPEATAVLMEDAHRAAKVIGAHSVDFGGLPDNRFDQVALLDVVKIVEAWLDRFPVTTIYTHHPGDLNIDHLVCFRAVLTATRTMAGGHVKEILSFEVPSSTEWSFGHLQPPFQPNVFVDVGAAIEKKIEAMECYGSERREWPHPRSPEALRVIAVRWGSVIGCDTAEAFQLIRSVR